MKVAALYTYPVKSLGYMAVDHSEVGQRGLKYDRRWMVVDSEGRFMTQREFPEMATVAVMVVRGAIRLSHIDHTFDHITISAEEKVEGDKTVVSVWNDKVEAISAGQEANAWLTKVLKQKCRLVYMPHASRRPVDREYSPIATNVSFADAFPFLLTNQASLHDLNMRAGSELSMLRFRPNIVVDSKIPFAEDQWKKLRIGSLVFHLVKPCARCVVTTIKPGTAIREAEPLRTLSGYRKRNNKVYFGQNMVVESEGIISVGDDVEVLE